MNILKLFTPAVDAGVHLLQRRVVDVGDDHVEAVVDRAVAVRLGVPLVQSGQQRGALGLHREVDDRGGAAPRRGAGAGLERVRPRTCRRTASPCACARRCRRAARTCRSRRSYSVAAVPGAGRARRRRAAAAMRLAVTSTSAATEPRRRSNDRCRRLISDAHHGLTAGRAAVGVRPAVAVERPQVADLGQQAHVQVADDHLVLGVGGGVADQLAARVDEVGLAVEVVVAQRLHADPVDRADEVLVRHRRRRLLEPPQVLRQAAAGRRRVEHDPRAGQARAPASPRGSAARSRCRRRSGPPRCRTPGSRGCRAGSRTSPRSPSPAGCGSCGACPGNVPSASITAAVL